MEVSIVVSKSPNKEGSHVFYPMLKSNKVESTIIINKSQSMVISQGPN